MKIQGLISLLYTLNLYESKRINHIKKTNDLEYVDSPSPKFTYNFMVSIQTSDFKHFCGGTLIDRWTVLTAAHCCEGDPEDKYVAVHRYDLTKSFKEENGDYLLVHSMIKHPKYKQDSLDNDVGIYKLAKMVPFGLDVDFIRLYNKGYSHDNELPLLKVIGWGLVDYDNEKMPRKLQQATMKAINVDVCAARWENSFTKDKALCTQSPSRNQTICNGDSGGPLFYSLDADPTSNNGHDNYVRYIQVGIVSFGEEECRLEKDLPDGFTRVSTYRSWILENMGPAGQKHRVRHWYNAVRTWFRGY